MAKLEQFLADHLLLMGAVGIGVACLQVSEVGDVFPQTCLGESSWCFAHACLALPYPCSTLLPYPLSLCNQR